MDNQTIGAIVLVMISVSFLAHRVYRGLGLGKGGQAECGSCSIGSCQTLDADKHLPQLPPSLVQIGVPKRRTGQKLPESR